MFSCRQSVSVAAVVVCAAVGSMGQSIDLSGVVVNQAGSPVSSGVYFYRLQAEAFTDTKKMILMR